MANIRIKRIYHPADESDGFRVLVDRLWPRGLKKETVQIDLWAKDLAPSTALRKWVHGDSGTWSDFEDRYIRELQETDAADDFLVQIEKQEVVTLLYGARDEKQNHAQVLQSFLSKKIQPDA